MKVGFTGSSTTVTAAQLASVKSLLFELKATEFHHGDCIVADEQAAKVADDLGIFIVGHPPLKAYKRAFYKNGINREHKGYLLRNKCIVKETETLLATPDSYKEILRSGTWSTIREAKRQKKPVYIIYPDGSYIKE